MRYWGKLAGVIVALFSGMGLWGAILGLLLGHTLVDRRLAGRAGRARATTRQALIFVTTFEVMGHLAKSKGRVTQADIDGACLVMDRMRLSGLDRQAAQDAFRAGKSPNYPLRARLRQLRRACFGRFDLIRVFLEVQLEVALTGSGGGLHVYEQHLLYVVSDELGVSRQQFANYVQNHCYQAWRQRQCSGRREADKALSDACRLLGVRLDQDAMTIKRAYRKLMSEHHPDKLVARGLPPAMMQLAKQKAQSIQQAYDVIKLARGFK